MAMLTEAATPVAGSDLTRKRWRLRVLVKKPPNGTCKSSQIPDANCVNTPPIVDRDKKLVGTNVRGIEACQFSKQVPKVNCGFEKSSVTLNRTTPVVGNRKLNYIAGSKRKTEEVLESSEPKRLKMDSSATIHCEAVLAMLMSSDHSIPFHTPFDPDIWDAEFDIIKKPMDLGTIKQKLHQNKYIGAEEFEADVRLTFSNAMFYNPPSHIIHKSAKELVEEFDSLWKPVKMKLDKEQKDIKQRSTARHLGQLPGKATPRTARGPADLMKLFSDIIPKDFHSDCKPNDFLSSKTYSDCKPKDSLSSKTHSDCKRRDSLSLKARSDCKPRDSLSPKRHSDCKPVSDVELSPSKALRVAQLKNRFAETILKAQHYTSSLKPGGEADKTFWQQKKESLQRKQQMEARIKAAESAANLKEESELKRQRQKAREAARMAVAKMERSVDVDNNYEVMKDLEALMGTPLVVMRQDHRSRVTMWGVDSDKHSSPLERLGLYIKEEYSGDDDDYTFLEEDREEGEFICLTSEL